MNVNFNFPSDFSWGVATAAYQIEGGWQDDSKGESIWDEFVHLTPSPIEDHSTGDVACDSYHRLHQDIDALKFLGVSHYRFSISWARVIPSGCISDGINKGGVDYYTRLIDLLLANQIEPMVTLYHWDLPLSLQQRFNGWNNSSIIQHFVEYAEFCFTTFGQKVKYWCTFNEPYTFITNGLGLGIFAPGVKSPGEAVYLAGHHVLLAHARAYRLYDTKYRANQNGQVGIALDGRWMEPKSSHPDDATAAERALEACYSWFADPIFKNGDYPSSMKQCIFVKSCTEGRNTSRLPEFTDEEKLLIQGTADFFGLNFYTSSLVEKNVAAANTEPSFQTDMDFLLTQDDSWPLTGSPWFRSTPFGIFHVLKWLQNRYDQVKSFYITENGFSQREMDLEDNSRVQVLTDYLLAIERAVHSGVPVKGYFLWSLMDNLEWDAGYSERFGLFQIDFKEENLTRCPRKSAYWYRDVIKNHKQ